MENKNSSYKQIVKSTSIFGGVQVVNILIGFVRNKVGAILLGPDGIGIIGMFQNIIDLVRSVGSLGIDMGGIRDIASNSGNKEKQIRSIAVFRWWIVTTACLCSLICLILSYPISLWAFENSQFALPVALLSLAVFFVSLSAGQTAILQGMRLIPSMVKASLSGNILSLFFSILSFYLWGLKGIVAAFILSSISLFIFSNRYIRKSKIPRVQIKHSAAFSQGMHNLRLGLYIVAVSIINTASMFIIRGFLSRQEDLATVGIFQAAWIISNIYLTVILKSIGTDFYPRLCSISESETAMRKLVNEQSYIALILGIPIVVVMMTFSKYVLFILYESDFMVADSLLQWLVIGNFFKILSWPIAFIMLAKGKGSYHLLAELLFFAVFLAGSYLLFPHYRLLSVGVSYVAAYIVYLIVVFIFALKLSNFRWNRQNILIAFIGLLFIAAAAFIHFCLSEYLLIAGTVLSLVSIVYTTIMLNKVLDIKELLNKIKNKISG